MALKATVFKADLQLADLDRNHFGDYALTLAQHPSETIERVMIRILGYALYASADLRFGRGLSNEEDAALWEIDPSGVTRLWIDVGLPDEARVKKVETWITAIEDELPPITTFFVSGGTRLAATCDVARTVARRAERRVVAALHIENPNTKPPLFQYLNRLSSLLYALARLANHRAGIKEERPRY